MHLLLFSQISLTGCQDSIQQYMIRNYFGGRLGNRFIRYKGFVAWNRNLNFIKAQFEYWRKPTSNLYIEKLKIVTIIDFQKPVFLSRIYNQTKWCKLLLYQVIFVMGMMKFKQIKTTLSHLPFDFLKITLFVKIWGKFQIACIYNHFEKTGRKDP